MPWDASLGARRAVNRTADALIGAAPTDVARHGGINVGIGRVRFFRQQCGRGHQLSGLAVAALWHLLRNPGRLQRVIRRWRQAFDRRHLFAPDARHRRDAGTNGLTVEVDRARPTLRQTAAEFRAGQTNGVANHPEQRHVRAHVNVVTLPVYGQRNHSGLLCWSLYILYFKENLPHWQWISNRILRAGSGLVGTKSPKRHLVSSSLRKIR